MKTTIELVKQYKLTTRIPKNFLSKSLDHISLDIRKKLKKQIHLALVEVRSSVAKEAPTGITSRILGLPIEASKSSRFNLMVGKGKIEASIAIARKKDMVILYLDQGTGIYGPKRRLIRPVSKRFMVFEINGRVIFTKKVKGIKPMRFVKRGIKNSKERVLQIISQAFK